MKISVIVPVYNVEAQLATCLGSIINQDYSDLEIILVNDGSTDHSGIICDQSQQLDERIIVIHKANGGLSSARNAGLEIASGDFISFVDSDDWVEPDFFTLLLDGIIRNNADISVVQFVKVRYLEEINFDTDTHKDWTSLTTADAMKELFCAKTIGYSAVNKLYRAKLFEDIRFPHGKVFEDKGTMYKLIHSSERVAVNKSSKYHYLFNPTSITKAPFNRRLFDSFDIHEEMIEFVAQHYPNLDNVVRELYGLAALKMLAKIITSNHNDSQDIDTCLKVLNQNFKYIWRGGQSGRLTKWTALLIQTPYLPNALSRSKIASRMIYRIRY